MRAARVVSIKGGLLVLQPGDSERAACDLAPGDRIRILRPSRDAAYTCRAVVVEVDGYGNLHLRHEDGEPERLQRRMHFRMRVKFPMIISTSMERCGELPCDGAHSDGDPAEHRGASEQAVDRNRGPGVRAVVPGGAESGGEAERKIIRAFQLSDLSAGGCLCEDPDLFLEVGQIYKASLQLNDKERQLSLMAKVVRRMGGRAGICFERIHEKDRERIMCALFREYRRRRSSETRGAGD